MHSTSKLAKVIKSCPDFNLHGAMASDWVAQAQRAGDGWGRFAGPASSRLSLMPSRTGRYNYNHREVSVSDFTALTIFAKEWMIHIL